MTNRSGKPLVARGLDIPLGPIKAPDSIVLWTPGVVRGDFPTNIWDAEAARAVMASYSERGNPIPIDIEHGTNPTANPKYDPAKPPPGGGYSGLELDASGALVLRPIRWSDYARAEIESGSRCAVSPDWDYDPATGRPIRLKKVSLVQNPGTYGIGLVASARSTTANGEQMDPFKVLLAALRAANTGDAENPQITALLDEFEAQYKGDAVPPSAEPMEGAAPEDKPVEKAALMAAAKLALASAFPKRNSATASATIDQGALLAQVKATVVSTMREEADKAALIASASASPGMTPGLANELRTLPLTAVARLVKQLPPPVPPADAVASAAATASAATGVQTAAPGKVAPPPLPGPAVATDTSKPPPSPAEQASIDFITKAAPTPQEKADLEAKRKADLAAKGVGYVSGNSLVSAAQERIFGTPSVSTKPN